jgi:REP element-mobilizing transposase RayT
MPQSFYKLYYHIIWSTKLRVPSIIDVIEAWLKEYIPKKISEYEGKQLALNMVENHLHLLVSIPPKISISEFIHKIKGSSSHYVNLMQNEKGFYWQSGYGVLSLSEKGIPFVKQYIDRQKEEHKNNELLDILEFMPEDEENVVQADKTEY